MDEETVHGIWVRYVAGRECIEPYLSVTSVVFPGIFLGRFFFRLVLRFLFSLFFCLRALQESGIPVLQVFLGRLILLFLVVILR